MILADYHMHSHHSGDSTAPMKDMIEKAIALGLKNICFTEHMDMDYPDCYEGVTSETFFLDTDSYKKECLELSSLYKDKIDVGFGVELGVQPQVADDNYNYVKKYGFDFVIASVHLVDKEDPYDKSFWQKDTKDNLFKRYFEATYENIKLFNDFDVLGHLDYMVRYIPEGEKTYSYEKCKEIVDEILLYLVKNDKGLDINTKALYSGMSFTNPRFEIIKRFKELGGKIITFGSDAHKPENIAGAFDIGKEIVLQAGFDSYYSFKNRIPTAHSLS